MADININEMAPTSGRQIGEANEIINVADMINQIAEGGGSIQGVINAIQNAVAAVDEGTASGGSASNLVDTTKAWQVNMWQGSVAFIMHACQEYACKIASNSATTLNFTALAVSITDGDTYELKLPVTAVTVTSLPGTPAQTADITTTLMGGKSIANLDTDIVTQLGTTGIKVTSGTVALSGSIVLQTNQQTQNSPGTPVQIGAGASIPCSRIYVAAKVTNQGNVYLGGSNVSSVTGLILPPGLSEWFYNNNADLLWFDTDDAGDGISWKVE